MVFPNQKDLFSLKFKSHKCSGGEKRTEVEKDVALSKSAIAKRGL